jgi:catechol 2,3-dioxygenase-like lactoylglutathione lyase family enzyme
MGVQLNHTIVWCSDKRRSTDFLTRILGLPEAKVFMHFLVVDLENGVSLDYYEKEGKIALQHYAFLIDEATFDGVFQRITEGKLSCWADPIRSRRCEAAPAKSIAMMAGAACISKIRTATFSK